LASQGPAADSEAAAPNPLHGAAEIPAHLDMPVENVLVLDCDIRDREKPHMVTEYMDEIYKYLKKTEVRRFALFVLCIFVHHRDSRHSLEAQIY